MGRPTLAQKRKIFKFLRERDGNKCYLCGNEFISSREPILEHLNDVWSDNREDNLGLAHQSCNIKKASNEDYQRIATNKLEKNESEMYVGESFFRNEEKKEQPSNEIEISNKCFAITEEYLVEKILDDGFIDYRGVIPTIVFLARKKIGHGSEQSIRSHLQALTSSVAPYEITKNKKGKKIIKKRTST